MSDCFVCNEALSLRENRIIKEKGVQTLIKSANIRGDVKNELMLNDVFTVTVHVACYKNYTNPKLALAASRRSCNSTSSSTSDTPREPQSSPSFDFQRLCFFCGEVTDDENPNRRSFSKVTRKEVRDSIIKYLKDRNDDFATSVIQRVENVADLVSVHARYHLDCNKRMYIPPPTTEKRKSITSLNIDTAMELIYSYIDRNSHECQFSFPFLLNLIDGDYKPDPRTVIRRLEEKYGKEEIFVCSSPRKGTVILLRSTGLKVLLQEWYESRSTNEDEEVKRFLRESARVLKRVIRSEMYDVTSYPPADNFLENINESVPAPLLIFLHELILSDKKGSLESWQRVCTSIAHQIISAVRPRSFLSSLKLSVGTFMYKTFGSRILIDVLFSLGMSTSYNEIQKYEISSIQQPEREIIPPAFTQYVFDNADFNVNTLDGHRTFHSMGGIQCVTPLTALAPDVPVKRVPQTASGTIHGDFGKVNLIPYNKPKNAGLQTLRVEDLSSDTKNYKKILPTLSDLMWLYGKWTCLLGIPSWNGFMEQATTGRKFEKTKVLYLPFINEPPSDLNTIHTALFQAVEKCKITGQKIAIVTFDLPLFVKARDIVAAADPLSDLKNVVVRLGGFHTLMSFLGSIGYIMSGSGLEDVLKLIYAPNCVEKILSGHAYARAVRAHFLVYVSLGKIIMDDINFTDEDRDAMDSYLLDIDRTMIFSAEDDVLVSKIRLVFESKLNEIEKKGRTACLWIQYFRMISLLKHFIEAERTGDWNLHLRTVERMLPIFHASGHFLYAKNARLYLQDMQNLSEMMPADEFKLFTTEGFFTMRFSDLYWPSFYSDMTIECFLMKYFKSIGGMTHGRGITENTIKKWTLGRTHLLNVCSQLESYCDVFSGTSEQHVDLRPTRISRDNADVGKLDAWFTEHQPFPEMDSLISISSGVVGGDEINCYDSFAVGSKSMISFNGQCYDAVTIKRSEKVLPLAAVSNYIKINSKPILIDPLKLFQRMLVTKHSNEDLKQFFSYELTPYPMSLFTEEGMRKGTKSSLYGSFSPLEGIDVNMDNRSEIIDGGWLLHKVVWDDKATFGGICQQYVSYVIKHFSVNVLIIFDGYPDDPEKWGTKTAERLRRSLKQGATDLIFDENSIPLMSQEKFLSNDKNKKKFINLLVTRMRNSVISVATVEEDADLLIVESALGEAPFYDAVFIIGSDVDLLVLLTGLCPDGVKNVFLKKPQHGRTAQQVFSPCSLKHGPLITRNVLFLHAFSGCDTTSAFFGIGKSKFISTLEKNPNLDSLIAPFKDEHADPRALENAGERFIISLYGGASTSDDLNGFRYQRFVKSSTKSKCNLAALPPTAEAAKHHTHRTYCQIQKWLSNEKNPEHWGWKKDSRGWMPLTTSGDPAPPSLMKLISCKCTKNCGAACGCRKAGLHCTVICQNCSGEVCDNVPQKLSALNEFEVDDNEEPDFSPMTAFHSLDDIDMETHARRTDSPAPSRKRTKNCYE